MLSRSGAPPADNSSRNRDPPTPVHPDAPPKHARDALVTANMDPDADPLGRPPRRQLLQESRPAHPGPPDRLQHALVESAGSRVGAGARAARKPEVRERCDREVAA